MLIWNWQEKEELTKIQKYYYENWKAGNGVGNRINCKGTECFAFVFKVEADFLIHSFAKRKTRISDIWHLGNSASGKGLLSTSFNYPDAGKLPLFESSNYAKIWCRIQRIASTSFLAQERNSLIETATKFLLQWVWQAWTVLRPAATVPKTLVEPKVKTATCR